MAIDTSAPASAFTLARERERDDSRNVVLVGFQNQGNLGLGYLAATLESAFGLCIGCKVFGLLMRIGAVPDDVCAECADIWSRPARAR